jgi:hypothetical protein
MSQDTNDHSIIGGEIRTIGDGAFCSCPRNGGQSREDIPKTPRATLDPTSAGYSSEAVRAEQAILG